MFTADTLDQIIDCSIEQVIGSYMKLSKKGANLMGCCPFHSENTPSFTVSPAKGIYKCFGCGKAGDVIEFVKEHDHLDFEDAVEKIASIAHIRLEYDKSVDKVAYETQRQERKSYSEVMFEAQEIFRAALQQAPGAIEYLNQRGYSREVINAWKIGFAPNTWHTISYHFKNKGLLPMAIKLGLCKDKAEGEAYDFYRGRIMIPILNERGDVVSFGGRLLPTTSLPGTPEVLLPKTGGEFKEPPKYLNGIQSPIYDKGKTLFGLYQAIPNIKKLKYAVLTEGYMDVMSLHIAGANNSVGICNNRLTAEQAILLKRYTDSVVIIPDNDRKEDGSCPGLDGAGKGIEILLEKGFKVDIMPLPDKHDEHGSPVKIDADDWAKQFVIADLVD